MRMDRSASENTTSLTEFGICPLSKTPAVFSLIRGILKILKLKHLGPGGSPVEAFGKVFDPVTGDPDYQKDQPIEKWNDIAFHFTEKDDYLVVDFQDEEVSLAISTTPA